jgi:hypothetical protein
MGDNNYSILHVVQGQISILHCEGFNFKGHFAL